MFNRYWRSYPWWMQLLQFVLMIFIFAMFAFAVAFILLPIATGQTFTDAMHLEENSSQSLINASLIAQGISSMGIFLLPALLFAYAMHPRSKQYLGLRPAGKAIHYLLAVLLVLSAFPAFLAIASFFSQFDLGAAAKATQEQNDLMLKAYLTIQSLAQFVAVFLVLAILPGLSEELFFRGVVMRFAAKRSPHIIFPILLSSLVFAMMHTNIYGMLSIFLAGMLLAAIYYLTGSLWCGIIAHIIYNGMQVALSYLGNQSHALQKVMESNKVPVVWVIGGLLIFAACFYALWKNRTPLSRDWAEDYSKEEIMTGEQ